MLVGIIAAAFLLMAKQDRPPVDGKLILASIPMTRAGLAGPGAAPPPPPPPPTGNFDFSTAGNLTNLAAFLH